MFICVTCHVDWNSNVYQAYLFGLCIYFDYIFVGLTLIRNFRNVGSVKVLCIKLDLIIAKGVHTKKVKYAMI